MGNTKSHVRRSTECRGPERALAGRANYVTQPLLNAGVSCQLKFLEKVEDRDKVVVSDESGNELARSDDMLHNRNFHSLKSNGAQISQKVLVALGKGKGSGA